MIRRSVSRVAVLTSSALLLGACSPTTEIYQVTFAQPAGVTEPAPLAQPLAGVEVDIEACRAARGSETGTDPDELGFVEIGRGCQMPIRWLAPRERGVSLRRFALVGGPYRCRVGAAHRSIRDVHGTVVGDDLSLLVDIDTIDDPLRADSAPPVPYLGLAEQVELRGQHDGSRDSNMICGLPAAPFLGHRR